jgi:hypothetical protein
MELNEYVKLLYLDKKQTSLDESLIPLIENIYSTENDVALLPSDNNDSSEKIHQSFF